MGLSAKAIEPTYFKLFIIYTCVMQLLSYMRSAAIFNTGLLVQYLLPIVIVLSVLFAFAVLRFSRKGFSVPLLLLLVGTVVSAVIGFLVNGISRDYASELLLTINYVLLIAALRTCKGVITEDMLRQASATILWAHVVFVAFVLASPLLGVHIYTSGLNSIYSAFPFVYYLIVGDKRRLLLSAFILVYCGKRGVLLATVVMLFIYLLWSKPTIHVSKLLGILGLSAVVLFVMWSTSSLELVSDVYPKGQMQKVAVRIHSVNPLASDIDYGEDGNSLITGARMGEITAATERLNDEPLYAISGFGLGYTYTYNGSELHNTHVSPVAFILRYGLLFSAIFYGLIIYLLAKGLSVSMRRKTNIVLCVFTFYAIAAFINSFTAFTMLTDLIFITALGVIYQITLDQPQQLSTSKNRLS